MTFEIAATKVEPPDEKKLKTRAGSADDSEDDDEDAGRSSGSEDVLFDFEWSRDSGNLEPPTEADNGGEDEQDEVEQ